jgi:hypothetical protein
MPAPEDKFAEVDDILFPIRSTGIVEKYELTEEYVKDALKQRYVLDNPAFTAPKGHLLSFLAGLGGSSGDAAAALTLATNIAIAIHNGWHGSGGTGTAAQVRAVIEEIKDAIDALGP